MKGKSMRKFNAIVLSICLITIVWSGLEFNYFKPRTVYAQGASLPPFNRVYNYNTTGVRPANSYEDVTGRGVSVWRLDWRYKGTTVPSACTITLEGSNDASTWAAALISGTCTSNGQSNLTQVNYNYLRVNMTALTLASAGSVEVTLTGYNDYVGITSGAITDPCFGLLGVTTSVSITTSTKLIPASAGKKNNICGGLLVTSAAVSGGLVEGTGTLCGTNTVGLVGGTSGTLPLAANEGFTINRTIFGIGTNVDTCWLMNSSPTVAGYITVLQQ